MVRNLIISIILVLLVQAPIFGQGSRPSGSLDREGEMSNDSTSVDQDSIDINVVTYKLIDNFAFTRRVELDTTMTGFQKYQIADIKTTQYQNTGNTSSPFQSLIFNERTEGGHLLFNSTTEKFGKSAEEQLYFNTATPYTMLKFGQLFMNRPLEETWIDILHTQNRNQYHNFGIGYRSMLSVGEYLNQESRNGNFNFFTSYEGDRYELYLSYQNNRVSIEENGGIVSTDELLNPDIENNAIPTWLSDSNNEIKQDIFSLTHRLKLGNWTEIELEDGTYEVFKSKVSLQHHLEYNSSSKLFTEASSDPYYTVDEDTIRYYNDDHKALMESTSDVAKRRTFLNSFDIILQEDSTKKYTFAKRLSGGIEIDKYSFLNSEFISSPEVDSIASEDFVNIYIGASISREMGKKWGWKGSVKYYPTGYNSQDLIVKASINKPIISKQDTSMVTLFGELKTVSPDYFYTKYFSNHHQWNNDFNKEQYLSISGEYIKPKWDLSIKGSYTLINNYTYWNRDIEPTQSATELSLITVDIRKGFHIRNFHSVNTLIWQISSLENVLSLPAVTVNSSTYFEALVIQDVLKLQVGIDARFFTSYFANNYSPALSQYYNQSDSKIGDLVYADAFLNIKIKRARAFVKGRDLNTLLNSKKAYLATNNYPIQPTKLTFGLAWGFYD